MTPDSTWVPIRTALADNTAELVDVIIDNNNTSGLQIRSWGLRFPVSLHYYNAGKKSWSGKRWMGKLWERQRELPIASFRRLPLTMTATCGSERVQVFPSSPIHQSNAGHSPCVCRSGGAGIDQCHRRRSAQQQMVATKQGVFVLSPDGTSLLSQYSVESTGGKLVMTTFSPFQFDGNRGVVYFGSESGLSSLEDFPRRCPVEKFDGLHIAPNPFIHPRSPNGIINGLVEIR